MHHLSNHRINFSVGKLAGNSLLKVLASENLGGDFSATRLAVLLKNCLISLTFPLTVVVLEFNIRNFSNLRLFYKINNIVFHLFSFNFVSYLSIGIPTFFCSYINVLYTCADLIPFAAPQSQSRSSRVL